jgi:hypothetical protein
VAAQVDVPGQNAEGAPGFPDAPSQVDGALA